MPRAVVLCILALTLVPAMPAASAPADDCGAGDAPVSPPRLIEAGTIACSGTLGHQDIDRYMLTLPPERSAVFMFRSIDAAFEICWVDRYCDIIGITTWTVDLSNGDPRVVVIEVSDWFGGQGRYELTFIVSSPPNDCGLGVDAPENYPGLPTRPGMPLAMPVDCTGQLAWSEAEHFGGEPGWYAFDQGDVYAIPASEEDLTGIPVLTVEGGAFNLAFACVGSFWCVGPGPPVIVDPDALRAGMLPMSISTIGLRVADYRFHFEFRPQDDCGSGGDAGATFANATPIAFGTCSGWLPLHGDEEDWYRLPLATDTGVRATVLTADPGEDLDVCLYRADRTLAHCVPPSERGSPTAMTIADNVAAYYVRVFSQRGGGGYSLVTEQVRASPDADSCAGASDAGNSPSTATRIGRFGDQCSGLLGVTREDTSDWYTLDLEVGDVVTVTDITTTIADATSVCLRAPDGGAVACGKPNRPGQALRHQATEPGRYTLELRAYYETEYYINLARAPGALPPGGDCASGLDGAAGLGTSVRLARGGTCQGSTRAHVDDEDWFRLAAQAGERIDLALAAGNPGHELCLVSPMDIVLDCALGPDDAVSIVVRDTGDHGVRVIRLDTAGSYVVASRS